MAKFCVNFSQENKAYILSPKTSPHSLLGAGAMTTKFLDNKICTFKIILSWRFPRKTAFLDDFPLCPPGPPLKSENFIFIVVSPSLIYRKQRNVSPGIDSGNVLAQQYRLYLSVALKKGHCWPGETPA